MMIRHRTRQFGHVFSGDGYSAGYYSYLWSDTLSADAWEAFTEAGGPYDKAVARRLHDDVFSAGNTVDPAEAYGAFRGRDPGQSALMRKSGFPVPAKHRRGKHNTPGQIRAGPATEPRRLWGPATKATARGASTWSGPFCAWSSRTKTADSFQYRLLLIASTTRPRARSFSAIMAVGVG